MRKEARTFTTPTPRPISEDERPQAKKDTEEMFKERAHRLVHDMKLSIQKEVEEEEREKREREKETTKENIKAKKGNLSTKLKAKYERSKKRKKDDAGTTKRYCGYTQHTPDWSAQQKPMDRSQSETGNNGGD